MSSKKIDELHAAHLQWIKELDFAKDELKTFRNRLSEVVRKNTKTDVLAPAEHFQNQFIRQLEVIDELKHEINAEEHSLVTSAQGTNVAVDFASAKDNAQLADQMQMFSKLFKELKDEYTKYLAKVL